MFLTRSFLLLVHAFIAAVLASTVDDSTTLADDGNGFESEGIDGHHGIFRSFDWTRDELRSISLWHATAQYQNVIELVKEKLASTSVHPLARQAIEAFIAKHKPPRSVRRLLSKDDRKRVKLFHRAGQVDRVLQIISTRLMQLDPEAREEVLSYLGFPHRQR
ncbi:Protein C45E1.4 [Aphelenchoides avenae]|nr:Protein C45E1.4 [Aphelenchus avenae]